MQQYQSSWTKKKRDWGHKFKPEYKNPYFKQRLIINWRLRIVLLLLIITALGWIYLFYFSPYFTIKTMKTAGLVEIPRAEFDSLLNDYLATKKLLVFKRNNIFIFNKADLKEKINQKFSCEEITVTKEYPNKIYIAIKEKSSVFIWQEAGQKLLVDKNGEVTKVYSEQYDFLKLPTVIGPYDLMLQQREQEEKEQALQGSIKNEGENKNILVNDWQENINISAQNIALNNANQTNSVAQNAEEEITATTYQIGQRIIQAEQAQFITQASQIMDNLEKLSLQQLEMPSFKEPSLNLVYSNSLKVLLNMDHDLEQQRNTFIFLIQGKLKNSLNNISYIDLRFGDKIYYK
jgi:cell division septal protein FtsQ